MTKRAPAITAVGRAVPGVVSEHRRAESGVRPLIVSGPPPLAAELRAALTEGGDETLVGTVGILDLGRPEIALGAAFVYVIRHAATPGDERALRRAERAGLPLVALVLRPEDGIAPILPYVLATDVVTAETIDGAAVARLASRIAARAPDQAWVLAHELPVLRRAAERRLVNGAARSHAFLAAAPPLLEPSIVPLTLGELRMLMRLLVAHGDDRPAGPALFGAVAACLGTGLACRALARRLRRRAPLPASVVDAAVAYGGTRALAALATRLPRALGR